MISKFALLLVVVPLASAYVHGNYYDMRIQSCAGQPSLHGLWWQNGEDCDPSNQFDINQISQSTQSLMNQYWTSCQGSMSNEEFWSHEWSKHGTCSGLSQNAFFTTAMNLFQQYGMSASSDNICFSSSFSEEPCPQSSSNDNYSNDNYDNYNNYYLATAEADQNADHISPATVVGIAAAVTALVAVVAVVIVYARRRAAAAAAAEPLEEQLL